MTAKRVLVQAQVAAATRRKLDALARARGCSRAAYLRRLVEIHVRAMRPNLLQALDRLPLGEHQSLQREGLALGSALLGQDNFFTARGMPMADKDLANLVRRTKS